MLLKVIFIVVPPYLEASTMLPNTMLIGLHHTWKALCGCQTPQLVMLNYRPKFLRGCQTPNPMMLLSGALHLIPINLLILFQQLNYTEAVAREQLMLFHLLCLLILRSTCTGWRSFALGTLQALLSTLVSHFCSIASLVVIPPRSLEMHVLS